MSKREEHTKQVKEKILLAADEILKNEGIEHVTVSSICKKAGVSIGSFYHHFSSKENVMAHYFTDAFEKRKDAFGEIDDGDVVASLLRSYRLYNSFLLEKGYEFIVHFYVPSNKGIFSYDNRHSMKESAPIVGINEEMIKHAIDNGYLNQDLDPAGLNSDLSVIEKGSVFDWCIAEGSYDLQKSTERLQRHYLMGCVTEKYKETFLQKKTGEGQE